MAKLVFVFYYYCSFLLLLFFPNFLFSDPLQFCELKEIPVRRGSILGKSLSCCSYTALYRNDYTNLTVRWSVDSGDREVRYQCLQQSVPVDNSTNIRLNCSKVLRPPGLTWLLNETDAMSLWLNGRPLEVSDSGVYDCYTSVDGKRYVSSVSLKVRDALPVDDLEPPVIPHIARENGNFTIRICWNGAQWPPETYDPVSHYEVRVVRHADNSLVSQSGKLHAQLPSLQLTAYSQQWNSPAWPLSSSSPCCCWEVPPGNLRPFSAYLASYRVFGEDPKHVPLLRSETNYSKPTLFHTPGMPGSVTRAELLELDQYGTGATVRFTIRPVVGEFPVAHQLNVTVIKPTNTGGKAADSDKVVVQSIQPEVNKTLDNLRPFSRYIVKAFVVNPAGSSEARGFSFITLPGELDPIRSLRADTLSASGIAVKFYIPSLDQQHQLMLGDDFRVHFSYTIAYEVLLPDLTSSICPQLDELCDLDTKSSQHYYDPVDCQCLVVESSKSRFIEEQVSIGNLRPNRPYWLSVRYFFDSAQFSGSALMWPETLYSPWTGLHGKSGGYVFTDSVGIRSPPYLRNVSLTVLNDNSTLFLIGFSVSLDLTLEPQLFESVWAIHFRCGNWSKVVPLSNELVATTLASNWQQTVPIQITEQVHFEVDATKEKSLPNGDKKCRFLACPLTKSRINSSFSGSIGPCSTREHVVFTLPDRFSSTGDADSLMPQQRGAVAAAIVAISISATLIFVVVAVIVTLYLKRRHRNSSDFFCWGQKLSGLRRPNSGDIRSSSSAGVQLLSIQPQQIASKRPLSGLSNNDGPLAGSMFCYKVASASFADFAQEFMAVCTIAASEARKNGFTTREAELQVNLSKNRYSNVLPYDHTRVTLVNVNRDTAGADYVNANFVSVEDGSSQLTYIACQGPLQWTTGDFWQIVYERNVTKIVMLTDLIESSHESQRKCAPYWPRGVAQAAVYKNWRVVLMRQRQRSYWIERVFELSRVDADGGQSDDPSHARLVLHFQFSDWPDHGVPQHALPLLRFTQRVMTANPSGSPSSPIVVHCSAGIGRSGVFMVLANELERLASRCQLDPAGCLLAMRRCRANLVQTPEQFRIIYLALYEAVRAQEVGDHCGLGVPTEANRLQAWLKFDAENGSKMCDWATSRVPLHNANHGDEEDFSFNGYGAGNDGGNNDSQMANNASYYLPGPLHSRQIAILNTRDAAFIQQRVRIWSQFSLSSDLQSQPNALHLVFLGEEVHEAGSDELAEQFRLNYPKLVVTSVSTWPPPNPSRLFAKMVPALLSNGEQNQQQQPASPSSMEVQSEFRTPCIVIVTSQLAIAGELALALGYLGEARLAFSVDADPDPDGHVDLLLFARIATLSLPPAVLSRSNLQRALQLVAATNVTASHSLNNLIIVPPASPPQQQPQSIGTVSPAMSSSSSRHRLN